jgi:hypothetical protein
MENYGFIWIIMSKWIKLFMLYCFVKIYAWSPGLLYTLGKLKLLNEKQSLCKYEFSYAEI